MLDEINYLIPYNLGGFMQSNNISFFFKSEISNLCYLQNYIFCFLFF